jgi:hypothetical protein
VNHDTQKCSIFQNGVFLSLANTDFSKIITDNNLTNTDFIRITSKVIWIRFEVILAEGGIEERIGKEGREK